MQTRGRHLAPRSRARSPHPAFVLCAALLLGCAAVGIVGLAYLQQLQDAETPYTSPHREMSQPDQWEVPLDIAPGHEDDPRWRRLASSPVALLRLSGMTPCPVGPLRGTAASVEIRPRPPAEVRAAYLDRFAALIRACDAA